MKKKIFYWSPFLSPIATCRAVINSAYSLNKYSQKYDPAILNFFGEFNNYKKQIENKNINLLNYYDFKFSQYLPFYGKIKSRFSFVIFFILGFFPLIKFLKKYKPEFLIIHLITSLPLTLLLFYKFETKFILRISGKPQMNFIRKKFWELALKKVYLITCPTNNTLNYLKKLNIVDEKKLRLLHDPAIDIKEIQIKKKEDVNFENYFLSVGRLSIQKNFIFLCKAFKEVVKILPKYKLLIAGEGEEESKLRYFINKNKLEKNIFLIGYQKNIFPYLKKAKGFILSSLWEDPGFVLIEAAICRKLVLSSNAWPGPIELIINKKNGYIFENNNIGSFLRNFKIFEEGKNKNEILLNGLKMSRKFTLFSHYNQMNKILNS